MRSSVTILTFNPYPAFKCGMTSFAIKTFRVPFKHHSWMAFFTFCYFSMGLMAQGACSHIRMTCLSIRNIKELALMTGSANRKWHVSPKYYSVVAHYPRFFWNMRVEMAGKAKTILKLLSAMSGMTSHTLRYFKICAMTITARFIFMRAIRNNGTNRNINGFCNAFRHMCPVAVGALCLI